MTGNTMDGLTSLDSNCIARMDVYGYEDNLMNPWTLYINKGTVQAGRAFVMVFDMCTWCDMGYLISLETIPIGSGYVSILFNYLDSFSSTMHSVGLGQIQQENATPYTSIVAIECLQVHSSELRHFHCPRNSSDMNIIEHIWYVLQLAIQKRSPPPSVNFLHNS